MTQNDLSRPLSLLFELVKSGDPETIIVTSFCKVLNKRIALLASVC